MRISKHDKEQLKAGLRYMIADYNRMRDALSDIASWTALGAHNDHGPEDIAAAVADEVSRLRKKAGEPIYNSQRASNEGSR